MSNNKINNVYTVEDIHDYLSGKMTAAEMHDIEKAALDDPLLAEAIEGFNDVPEFTQQQGFDNINEHLIDLRAKFIDPKPATISINKYKMVWRIAAAILLLIGSAVLVTYFTDNFNHKPSQNIAKVEPDKTIAPPPTVITDTGNTTVGYDSEVKTNQPEIATLKKEKTAIETVEKKIEEETVQTNDEQSKTLANSPERDIASASDEKIEVSTITPAPAIERNATVTEKRKEELSKKKIADNNAKNVIFSGKVVDKNNKPVPYASLKTEEGLMSTTDNRGMFSLPITRKRPGRVTFRANNFLQKTVPVSGNYQVIILENNRVSNSNNNNNLARAQNKPGQVLLLNKNGAEPKEGWEKYLNYLIERVSFSEYDTGKPVVGETIVGFDIKANGEPTNFSFEKQIDTDVNDAVEDLIITGPEWKLVDGHSAIGHVKLKIIF